MYLKDLKSNEYAVQATTTVDNEVNGNQSITGTIEYTKVNAEFIDTIDRLWRVYDHDDVGYKIIMLNRQGKGNKMYVDFTAIPLFFDYMDTNSIFDDEGIHYRYDGSLTAKNAFDKIFADTPFDYAMVDSATSVEWENFGGGESRLETFKRAIERYHYEFEISGSTVFLKNQAGRDTTIQYRHRFNASDIKQEIDASKQYTAIKGYGNFGERTGETEGEEDYRDARLKREYISPLADILGVRWSPPFTDGRVKVTAEMDRKLKAEVDNSLKVSVSANIHNLSKQGYPIDKSQAGDRVFLIDERIGFDEEVRIVSQSITRNWLGDVIDASVTFGSEGLGKRHQSTINTAVKNITDIFEGRKEMPLSHLDKRVQEISNIINGNTDSVFKYTPNGIIGWNGDDANYMTRYVGDAIGFSKDGGNTFSTAMSADLGIVADYITSGTLRSIIVEGVEIYGSLFESRLSDLDYLNINGARLESRGQFTRTWRGVTETHDIKMIMENGYLRARNDSKNYSLYFSDMGISTFADGSGEEGLGKEWTSGTLAFRDEDYSSGGDRKGVTLLSTFGSPALESGHSSIYLAPNRQNREGANFFSFTVKASDSYAGTDGWIGYGTIDQDSPFGSGLRFSKNAGRSIIYATNRNGDVNTADIQASNFIGELRPHNENIYLKTYNGGEVRITASSGYNDGNPSYMDLRVGHVISSSIRSSGSNMYIGARAQDDGEVRITNHLLYNDGNVGYRPIKASSFVEASSKEYKSNIKRFKGKALDVVNSLEVVEYNLNDDVINQSDKFAPANIVERQLGFVAENSEQIATLDKKAVNHGKTIAYHHKAIQELYNILLEKGLIDE